MAQIILDSNSNLIQGDFDSATVNNRTKLQTSTTNATTGVYVVPNGSATSASVQMANAADPTNASKIVVATNGATDTQIVSGANGSGSYLPLSFYTNNDIRFQMGNAGELNVRTAPGTVSSGTAGQVLTSGGPGAGVSWASGGFSNMQVFASPGTFTTPSTTTQIKVTVVGGGGGGGAQPNASGGGGGGAAIYVGPVTASTPYAVTVGTGGGSAAAGNTSSFASLASATGGGGGVTFPSTAGGLGGAGSVGTLQVTGSPGFNGGQGQGNGGPSILGGGARGTYPTGGNIGGNYGGGGSGSNSVPSPAGGAGAGGVVIVEF